MTTAAYPRELVECALLDDDTRVIFRPIDTSDGERLERLFHRLSPMSLYRRFFTPVPWLDTRALERLVKVDYVDRLALVALVDDEVVGVARYDRLHGDPKSAEVAVIVEDAWQGRGIATRLLWRLSAAARARGLAAFVAEIQGENRPMMGLLGVLGDDLDWTLEDSTYHVRIGLTGVPPPA